MRPDEHEEASEIIRSLLGTMGERCHFVPPVFFDYGSNVHIGDFSFVNSNFTALDAGRIDIGRHVFIGPTSASTPRPIRYSPRSATQAMSKASP